MFIIGRASFLFSCTFLYASIIYVLFTTENYSGPLSEIFDLLDDVLTGAASMGTIRMPSGEIRSKLEHLPLYSVETYIRFRVPRFSARELKVKPPGESFTMCAGYEELGTSFVGRFKR